MDEKGRWMDNVFIERLLRNEKYQDTYLKAYERFNHLPKGWKSGSGGSQTSDLTSQSLTKHQVRFTTTEVVENPEKKRHEKRKETGRDWTSAFQQHSTSLRSVPYCGFHYDVQRRNERGARA